MGWGWIVRVGAAIATGGNSEVVLYVANRIEDELIGDAAAAAAAAGALVLALQAANDATKAASDAKADNSPLPAVMSPRYQITGDFLLHSGTGKAWKYSGTKKAFVPIPVEEDSTSLLLRSNLLNRLKEDFDVAYGALPAKSRSKNKGEYTKMVAQLDGKIIELGTQSIERQRRQTVIR